jgi:hypothetical protein
MADYNIDPAMTLWMENLSVRVPALEAILKQRPQGITDSQIQEARELVRAELGLDKPPDDLFRRAHALIERLAM